jgi:hypothetical protein
MGAFEILWALAILASGTLFAGWFGMRLENRYRPAATFFVLGFVPLVAIDIAWTAMTSESWCMRIIVSGLIGATAGAAILITSTESLRLLVTGAEAQGEPPEHHDISAQTDPDRHNAAPPAPPSTVNQGPGSAYSNNQKGGVIIGTLNIAPGRLAFSPPLGEKLLDLMPDKTRLVSMTVVGGSSAQATGDDFFKFLKDNGYGNVALRCFMWVARVPAFRQ